MYYDLMTVIITVSAGDPAAYYPAPVPLRDRDKPGLRFELGDDGPWQWAGAGGPLEVTLADVLAAVSTARLTQTPGWDAIDPAAIQAAHQKAVSGAIAAGNTDLAGRLSGEQAEVSPGGMVSEETAAARLGITGRSLNNLRVGTRAICPPVFIAGNKRTKWFWAPGQFGAWCAARPGRGWWRAGTRHGDTAPAGK